VFSGELDRGVSEGVRLDDEAMPSGGLKMGLG